MGRIFTFDDDRAAALWSARDLAGLPVQQIRGPNGEPYLDRYFLSGWSPYGRRPGPTVYLHHFLASDPDLEVHSHPWDWSLSLMLAGGYREFRCQPDGAPAVREVCPGELNIIRAGDRHRVDLLGRDAWSLFLAGHFQAGWGFASDCGGPLRPPRPRR